MSFLKQVDQAVQKSFDLVPSEYRGFAEPPVLWEDTTFDKAHAFRWEDHFSSLKAYHKCPPLAAILNRMAQAYINGQTFIMNTQGKEATSADAKKIRKLLMKPNPLQSWKQFEAQQQIYIDLFGWSIVLPIIPFGFEGRGPIEASSLWNIPPFMVDIEETSKLFYQTDLSGILKTVRINYRGVRTDLPINSIYIFRDFIPSEKTLLFPESRICSLEMPINNIIGAYESRNVLINYRGALGVFTQEPNRGQSINRPMTPDEKDTLQREFRRYGLKNTQWKFIFASAALKWQQMGIPTKDLMLFEEIRDDIMRICDQYGYPSPLVNTETGPAVSNTKQYKAQLYQDAIIPRAELIYEQWNSFFKTDTLNLTIEKDYSHVAVLQEDELAKWQAKNSQVTAVLAEWKADVITRNRMLVLLGEDPVTTPDGNMYFSEWDRAQQRIVLTDRILTPPVAAGAGNPANPV